MRAYSSAVIRYRFALVVLATMAGLLVYSNYTRPLHPERTLLYTASLPSPQQKDTSYVDYNLSLFDDVWRRSEERLRHLDLECSKTNRSQSYGDTLYNHLLVDSQRKILYCSVPKVACTSWKRIFLKMVGLSPPSEDINSISRTRVHTSVPTLSARRFKGNREEILRTYRKFLFVRHPFDRVLAAYKDKLLKEDKHSLYDFHKFVGTQIETMLRRPSSNGHDVTFPDFVEWLTRASDRPTNEQRNEHWVSVHDLCSPCSVRYDFLGKYETLSSDAAHVLEWLQVTNVVAKFPGADQPSNAGHFDPRFYDQLSYQMRQAFVTKYHDDFLPFQYQTAPTAEKKATVG